MSYVIKEWIEAAIHIVAFLLFLGVAISLSEKVRGKGFSIAMAQASIFIGVGFLTLKGHDLLVGLVEGKIHIRTVIAWIEAIVGGIAFGIGGWLLYLLLTVIVLGPIYAIGKYLIWRLVMVKSAPRPNVWSEERQTFEPAPLAEARGLRMRILIALDPRRRYSTGGPQDLHDRSPRPRQ